MWFVLGIQGQPHSTHMYSMYIQCKQLQILYMLLHYTLHFTHSLGENNGLFREESNETEKVSINQFIVLLHTNVMYSVLEVLSKVCYFLL